MDKREAAELYRYLDCSRTLQEFYSKSKGLRGNGPRSLPNLRFYILHYFKDIGCRKPEDVDQWHSEVKEGKRLLESEFNAYLRGLASNPDLSDSYISATRVSLLKFARILKLGDIELDPMGQVKLKRVLVPYSKSDVVALVNAARSLRDRLIVQFATTSGIRVGAMAGLKVKDVREVLEKSTEPYLVSIPAEYSKSGLPYISFINEETAISLREWIKTKKLGPEDRIFPKRRQIEASFTLIKKRADLESPENRIFHGLRKYFKTVLVSSGVPEAFSEMLMGHSSTTLQGRYTAPPIEQLRQEYSKALGNFAIYGRTTVSIGPSNDALEKAVLAVFESWGITFPEHSNPIELMTQALKEGKESKLRF